MTPGAIDQALTAPPAALGKRLLDLSENQWFDRKSFRIEPRKLAESLVGFANADGGTIAIGLSRDEVEGVGSNDRHLNSLMQAAVDFTEPTVVTNARLYECIREDGQPDHLLIIEVPPGSSVHTTSRDDAFLRIGDENHKLSFTQRRELFYDKSQSTFEAERTEASLDDVDRSLLDSYANVLEATEPERLLVARGLAADPGNSPRIGLPAESHRRRPHRGTDTPPAPGSARPGAQVAADKARIGRIRQIRGHWTRSRGRVARRHSQCSRSSFVQRARRPHPCRHL